MTTEYLFVHNGGNWETVETVSKCFPQFDIKSSFACLEMKMSQKHFKRKTLVILTFIVESVYSVNTGTLMVSSQEEEIFRIFDLVREQEANGLQALFATIDVIAKE